MITETGPLQSTPLAASPRPRHDIVMLLENNPYPEDVRVRQEAESLVRRGHKVQVIAPRGPGQPRSELVAGVAVRRFRVPSAGHGLTSFLAEYFVANVALHLAAVRELVRGATVLHLHNPPDTLFGAALLARALKRRVVFDHHDLFPELVAEKFGSPTWRRLAGAAERATFAVSDRVLAANESHAELARARGRKLPAAVSVVRNGPPARTIVAEPVLRGGCLADPHLVYLGAIAEQDGVELLSELLARLRDDHALPATRLTIIGDGPAREAVEARLRAKGVDERVTITGWVHPESVPGLLAQADICVDPAPPSELNHRSTMVKIAEYLAAGRPVVAFKLLETARTTGDAALLATPGDIGELAAHVAALSADSERRARLSELAVRRARTLSWEHSERALLAVYERL